MRGFYSMLAVSPSPRNTSHDGAHGLGCGFNLFKGRPKVEHKKRDIVTALECPECSLKTMREFQRGDYLFKRDEPCSRCESLMVVTAIHTREEQKQGGALR